MPLAMSGKKIKMDSSIKNMPLDITLKIMILVFCVLTPKIKATINPMSIIANKTMLICKSVFGYNLVVTKTNSVATSKEIVQRMGFAIFLPSRMLFPIISPLSTFLNYT